MLSGDPLYLIQRDLFLAAVVEHGGAGRFVVGDVLGRFQGAVVLEVSGDTGGAEGVVADAGLDAGGGEVGVGVKRGAGDCSLGDSLALMGGLRSGS